MVNEERVKLMTKMAIFEKNDGDRCLRVAEYRRRDYMALCGWGQFFLGTLVYLLIIVAYFVLGLKEKLLEMSWEEMEKVGFKVVFFYILFTIVYQVVVRIRAKRHYDRCLRKMMKYEDSFATLGKMYKREDEYTAPLEYIENETILRN